MEVQGKKKEVVTLYNKKEETVKTISTKEIKKDVVQTYIKETTTPTG